MCLTPCWAAVAVLLTVQQLLTTTTTFSGGGGGGGVLAIQPLHASPEFRGRAKTREERWHLAFGTAAADGPRARADNLVRLLLRIEQRYLSRCVTVVAYDAWLERNTDDGHVLRSFLRGLQRPYMHGRVDTQTWRMANGELLLRKSKMVSAEADGAKRNAFLVGSPHL